MSELQGSDNRDQVARNLSIRYDCTTITHTSQFVLSPGEEDLHLDFSSGLIREHNDHEVLPINTRLAMSWTTAQRLSNLLNQVIGQHQERQGACASAISEPPAATSPGRPESIQQSSSVPAPKMRTACLPTFRDTENVER